MERRGELLLGSLERLLGSAPYLDLGLKREVFARHCLSIG